MSTLPKDIEAKLRTFIRFAKTLASYLKDGEKEDFLNEIADIVATYVGYVTSEETTITVDLEHEKVIIR